MPAPVVFHHPSSLLHDTGYGHPERPARLQAVVESLSAEGWLGYEPHESPAASDEQLHAVHPPSHVARIDAISVAGGGAVDADTVLSAGSAEAARRAAGGACALVDALRTPGGARVGASLHRPPGHHCEADRAMGFCLFSTIAVAARWALDHHGLQRVLVLDWDVHHGNGTAAVLAEEPRVLFASIHESPLYPGTGAASEVGVGAGRGTTVNVPVPAGSGDDVFCSVVEHAIVPLAREFAPELILVSAGFDAHLDDPLAGCAVTDAGFAGMAGSMRRLADELGVGLGIVLEGGYELEALVQGLAATMIVAASEQAPDPPTGLAVHPLAAAALERALPLLPVV